MPVYKLKTLYCAVWFCFGFVAWRYYKASTRQYQKKKKKKVIMFIDRDKRNTVTEVKIVK